jgi:hypothetical protein
MNLTHVLQLFKGRECQSGPSDTLVSNENGAIEDTISLEEQRYECASEELSISKTGLARLRTEYLALAETVREAEGRFQHALRALHSLRCRQGG